MATPCCGADRRGKHGGNENFPRFARRPRRRTDAARRAQLLAAFDRSGLSAVAFARRHGLHYTTFCGWRQQRARASAGPAFVEVEMAPPAAPTELLIELGASARLRLHSPAQVALAAQLLHHLHAARPC